MKTILFATDYTEHSITALQYTHKLSSKLNATLIVLHIYDVPAFAGTTMIRSLHQTQKRAREEQRSLLKAYCKKHLGDDLDEMNIKTVVGNNISITEEILYQTRKLSADMVVIGIKDENSRRGFLQGDIAKTLITQIPCPLLVIPANKDAKHIEHIVYATDFEEGDIFAIDKLSIVALPFKATIHIVHISTHQKEEDENQMAWFKEMVNQKVRYPEMEFDLLVSDNVYETLIEYLKNKQADMVALLEREDRGFFKKIFHTDLVKQVESHTSIPLISFNSIDTLKV